MQSSLSIQLFVEETILKQNDVHDYSFMLRNKK